MGASRVVVYGATGHTGRFVVAELVRRGVSTVASGRSAEQLDRLFAGLEVRRACVEDAGSLDRALAGTVLVVNCAGPFALTAGDAFVIPPGMATRWAAPSADLELLEVSLPGRFGTALAG